MTKKKAAGRSTERPGQPKENQSGLPYGTGSLQQRGRTYWIMYRDPEGRSIQENSRLEDYDAARRMLAEKAIITLEARLAVLKEIARETPTQGEGAASPRGDQAGHGKQHSIGGGPVRNDAAKRGDGKSKTRKGGKA